ncbi:cell adhesion molecule CEACAM10-like [Arvicanthis niloticus]|uniref:cell adhesion molecule CEACAM10-like n=1 Tax=Arvicanthis niloticus TaxID=61156 RepID=UPI001486DB03|nr:carcinoembryonic antigen-related cell adhesion molecule 10-like [Arvicanthis niloticus]
MELASARLHKGQISWWGLLLTASLLTTWSPPTTAQVTIEAVPPDVAEGKDVLLLVHNLPQALRVYYWFKRKAKDRDNEIVRFIVSKNENITGLAYSGRETVYSNGSLLFQNVKKSDEGVYILYMLNKDFDDIQKSVRLYVHSEKHH